MAAPKSAPIQVVGLTEFKAAMRRMGGDLKDLTAINKRAAETVADEGRSRAPHVSGNLAGTIRAGANQTWGYVKAGNNKKKRKGKSTHESGAVPYAGPIHFGWPAHGISPNPFLYEALDARRFEVVDAYEAHIEGLVEKVGRETPP